jgi:transcriptional antiterminator RfaH
MPILAAEPTTFPPDLFAEVSGAVPNEVNARQWSVLHVKPRQEKSLARDLFQREIPYYLPLVSRHTVARGRALRSHLPLFPGYVFLFGTPQEWLTALNTGRVVRPLNVPNQCELWNDLRQVSRLIASRGSINPEHQFLPGTPVEIQSGPLAGLRGVVQQTATGRRLWIQVRFIQSGASVLLDDCLVAPLANDEWLADRTRTGQAPD